MSEINYPEIDYSMLPEHRRWSGWRRRSTPCGRGNGSN